MFDFTPIHKPIASFRNQLALTFTVGIALLAAVSSFAITHFSTEKVRSTLIEHGHQAADTLAAQSTLALLYESAENARTPATATLALPDVLGVIIYDSEGERLLALGETVGEQTELEERPRKWGLLAEDHDAWYFAAPAYAGEDSLDEETSPFDTDVLRHDFLGHVLVVMGKQTLKTMESDIREINLFFSLSFATIILVALLAITARMTTPLKNLAEKMYRAEEGEESVRFELTGPKDIIDMGIAFNTMMEVLEERERELTKARDAAIASASAKEEFAANVSHELRTPMNGVLGMLELLQDMGLTSKQAEYGEVARKSAETQLTLIDDILDFSRIDSGKLKPNPVDFSLQDVLDDVVGITSGQAQRKGLDLGYVIEQYVPSRFRGEPGRIRQVLINLVSNATKFTKQGEIAIEVRVVEESNDNILVRFEVRDTGIGISQEVQQRIFEPFTQADGSTTRKYGGTGLGLAICRQVIGFLGGEIDVSSELGRGSTFWFEIPLQAPEEKVDEPEKRREEIAGMRVLIVDDSSVNRSFLEKTFAAWGAYQNSVSDGSKALASLRFAANHSRPFDLVIIDEVMPGIAGDKLARQILEDDSIPPLKTIMMTTWRRSARKDSRYGIDGVVTKPVRQSLLFDCIASITKTSAEQKKETTALEANELGDLNHSGKRILVVEDNRANQQVALGMLERLGCRVDVATTGRDALESIARRRYDFVLMDCNMPEMDGYETTRRIRQLENEQDRRLPIVAMTANVQKGDSERCLAAGMDDYLPKPLKLDMINSLLGRLTSMASATNAVVHSNKRVNQQSLDDLSPLDVGTFSELREDIGDIFTRMIEVFLEDLPGYLHALERAVLERDYEAMRATAHTIKGSSANFGATRLSEICRQLEEKGRECSTENTEELMIALGRESDRVVAALNHEIKPDKVSHTAAKETSSRILVVDDDRSMRLALREVLEGDGYQVDEASNGAQAIAVSERHMADLVLMDAVMPGTDGFTACKRIRHIASEKQTPILMITALEDEPSIERAFASGATDYIPKPVHFGVLRQRIGRLLDASQKEQHVRHLAYNDPLTGLPNRALFMESLASLLRRRTSDVHSLALLFLDLDRFKMVNDTLGHDAGDMLLKAAADRIVGCVRNGDMVARLGGDEFTIILDDITSHSVAASVAEKICNALSSPFSFMGQEMYVSTSIGISVCPEDGKDIGALMKHADTAMFRAKERGGRYQFYEAGMEAEVTKRLEMESDLRRALERDELTVHYQPQMDLKTGAIIGMEALIRWEHPERGLIPPSDFIPLAEETGLIRDLGEVVLKLSCAQTQAWLQQGFPPLRIAVNISGRQLEDRDLPDRIAGVLNDTGLHYSQLELEITESTIMSHPEEVIPVLTQLKEMGITLAIDDFGTGYSSLSYLKRFPIDMLKIDRAFVRDLTTDLNDKALIRAIIALAKSLNLKTLAEGVETREQEKFLMEQACDYIQGFYISKPLNASILEQKILRRIKEGRPIIPRIAAVTGKE